MIRKSVGWLLPAVLVCGATLRASGGQLPSDVRANHWAAGAVRQILPTGIMSVSADGAFHGEAKVTHAQAVIALVRLAKLLEAGKWQAAPSQPVPDKVSKTLNAGDWETSPVSRFSLASILTRFGDYFANAVPRPKSDAKDLGKSEVVPTNVKVTVAASNPAYESLVYLTKHHMISASSPLLKADDRPVKGAELSRGLTEMTAGLNDLLTEMGHDEKGATPDATFQHKTSSTVPPGKK